MNDAVNLLNALNPAERVIFLSILILIFSGGALVLVVRVSKKITAAMDNIFIVRKQLENDHVVDPNKKGNLREDLDEQFSALHTRLDIMGRVTAANTQSISTIVSELAEMNGKEVVSEHTVNGTEVLKIKGDNYG